MAIPTLEELREYNPRLTGEKFVTPAFRRQMYGELLELVKRRKYIVGITGMRRTGKTTIMKQVANQLEDSFFFSFEEDRFANYEAMNHVIREFSKLAERPIIMLDEVSRVDNWAGLLKKYHDLGKASFVVSGSASLEIKRGKESLAGRLIELSLPPLQFREYLALKKIDARPLRFPKTSEGWERAFLGAKDVGAQLVGFLKKGGLPELVAEGKEEIIKRYVKSTTVERIVFSDIPSIFRVEERSKLYSIMEYVARESGSIVKPSHLGEALGLSKDTVANYLYYLSSAFLIGLLPIEGSTVKGFRRPKKAYASCAPIAYALQDELNMPCLAETAVYDRLANGMGKKVWYYRNSFGREVDFLTEIPIAVKWKSVIEPGDYKDLVYYMRKKRRKFGLLITKDRFETIKSKGAEIAAVPLWLFLLAE